MNNSASKADYHDEQHTPYSVNVPVWVQCKGYRCLAVFNQKGEWRTYLNNELLQDVVRVVGEFSQP